MTQQRQAILEELRKVTTHPMADEVYAMVRRRLPRISLATVYRNLETLNGLGMIQKVESGEHAARFDGNPRVHYHVRCVRCGRLEDLAVEPDRTVERAAERATGYAVLGHRTEIIGVCPTCASRDSRRKGSPGKRK